MNSLRGLAPWNYVISESDSPSFEVEESLITNVSVRSDLILGESGLAASRSPHVVIWRDVALFVTVTDCDRYFYVLSSHYYQALGL